MARPRQLDRIQLSRSPGPGGELTEHAAMPLLTLLNSGTMT
jgi:hypothetical protein